MAAALKLSVEEHFENLDCLLLRDEAGGHRQHVGVVVRACKARDFLVPTQCSADALMLVCSHCNAVAAAADGDAVVIRRFLDLNGERMRVVGIVATLGGVGAEVCNVETFLLEVILDEKFLLVARVVGGYE